MSYLICTSFPRKVFTTLKQCWLGFCVPWQLASGCPCWCLAVYTCQLVASASQHRVCGFCLYSFLTPCAQPFQANQAWTQCSWWVWLQFLFQSQSNSQGHSFFGYSAVISKCHLWACTDTHSSLLFPVLGVCCASMINTAGQVNFQATVWHGGALVNINSAVTPAMAHLGSQPFDRTSLPDGL